MTNRKTIIYIVGGLLLAALVIGLLSTYKRPTNWKKSFSPEEIRPFGNQLVVERMKDLYEGEPELITQRPFEKMVYEIREHIGYVFLNSSFTISDSVTISELYDFAFRGNAVFISVEYDNDELRDKIFVDWTKIEIKEDSLLEIVWTSDMGSYQVDSRDVNYSLRPTEYVKWEILAYAQNSEHKWPIMAKVPVGEGYFIISSTPSLLTNFYLLNSETTPMVKSMLASMESSRTIWWDHPTGRPRSSNSGGGGRMNNDPPGYITLLKYLMEFPSFAWALWILIIGGLFYVVFEGKRKQRPVPDIEPLPNTTLDFTRTIGRLYYQVKNNRQIALKRVKVLLAYIRSHYNLPTHKLDKNFEQQLVNKSGATSGAISALCYKIRNLDHVTAISDEDLMDLMREIESFYLQAGQQAQS